MYERTPENKYVKNDSNGIAMHSGLEREVKKLIHQKSKSTFERAIKTPF